MVDTGILFSNMSLPLTNVNDILTLDQLHWIPYQSDFTPIVWPWYRAWPLPNYEWFPWSICNLRTLTLSGTRFRPFWDLLILQLLRPVFPNLLRLFSTFHLEYPSVLSRFGPSTIISYTNKFKVPTWLKSLKTLSIYRPVHDIGMFCLRHLSIGKLVTEWRTKNVKSRYSYVVAFFCHFVYLCINFDRAVYFKFLAERYIPYGYVCLLSCLLLLP